MRPCIPTQDHLVSIATYMLGEELLPLTIENTVPASLERACDVLANVLLGLRLMMPIRAFPREHGGLKHADVITRQFRCFADDRAESSALP